MSVMNVSFTHTEKTLCQLEDQLRCCICHNFARCPVTLGGCEHLFCSVCCEDYLGKSCPICKIPAHVKDAEKDRQLYNLATLCHRLRRVLAGEITHEQCPTENNDGIIESTPNQPIPGSASYSATDEFLSATKLRQSRSTKQEKKSTECRSKQNKVKLQKSSRNSSTRRDKRRSGQSTMTQFYDSDSNDDKDDGDDNMSKVTNETKSRKSGSRQSKGMIKCDADNQSTMTQFYEGDDNGEDTDELKKIRKKSSDKTQSSEPQEQTTMTQFYEHDDEEGQNEILNNVKDCATGKKETNRGLKSQKRKSVGDSGVQRKTRLRQSLEGHELAGDLREMSEEPAQHITKAKSTKNKRRSGKSLGSATHGNSPLMKKDTNSVKSSDSPKIGAKSENSPVLPKKQIRRKSTSALADSGKQENITLSKNQLTSIAAQTLVKGRVASPGIDKRNAKGETALQVAAIKNDVSKVRELLASGANPNVRDNAGWTPLHEACNHGYVEVATFLLDNGALINVPGLENDTAVHDAINNNRLDCVRLLVSRGASLSLRNMHGQTPVDLAVSDAMKEALETPVTVPAVNPDTHPLDVMEFQQPCLLGTGLSRDEKITLQKAGSQLKVKLADEVTPEVTHIVTRCNAEGMCPRTIKLLQGILMGKWIMNMEWLATCMEVGSLVCEEAFEVQGTSLSPNSKAPYKGRINRKQQLPGLFNGCQFYFHGSFEYATPSKEELISLVKAGDGQLLTREPKPGHLADLKLTVPYHSDPTSEIADCCIFLVHESHIKFQPVRTRQMCSIPVSWIMDCASHFKLLSLPAI